MISWTHIGNARYGRAPRPLSVLLALTGLSWHDGVHTCRRGGRDGLALTAFTGPSVVASIRECCRSTCAHHDERAVPSRLVARLECSCSGPWLDAVRGKDGCNEGLEGESGDNTMLSG